LGKLPIIFLNLLPLRLKTLKLQMTHFPVKALLLLFLFPATFLKAQEKMLTIEDAILKANNTLAPENLQNLQWRGPSTYTFTKDNALMQGDVGKKGYKKLLTLKEYNHILAGNKLDTAKSLANPQWLKNEDGLITQGNNLFLYHHSESKDKIDENWEKVNTWDTDAENTDIDKEKQNIAYTKENNLFISMKGGKVLQVTKEENKGIVNGSAGVHRNEFGIKKGTFWSPMGNMLAYYRMDQSMVTDYPLVDISERPAKEKLIKYPMAGMKSHEVTVGVYNLNTGKTVFLKTAEPKEQYLTNISWSPDEKYIYIQVLNRGQNDMKLNKYDVATGDFVKTLFEEKNDKYVEPLNPLIFFSKTPHEFLYMSQKDGWMHFYRYNDEGKFLAQVTKGNWLVTEYLGMNEAEDELYFTSTMESPVELNIYSVGLKNNRINKISSVKGTHSGIISPGGKYVLDRFSSTTLPREIDIEDSKGKVVQNILRAANPLKDYKLGETKLFTIKANDGTELYSRIILPPGFNPGKKYPSITYLYNGPHVQLITNSWLANSNLWMQYMAQQGYIVFTIDGRGSMNRGMAFEQAVFRRLGTIEMEDQLTGNKYLRGLSYIDTTRMGIHGWSFGGFMTTTMMLKAPGTYKVAVAGGPVIDWKYYEVMYTERYMDTPEENKEGYETANLLNYVKNLNGKLMLIHGTVDDVVLWQHSQMFIKKCVDEGKQLDYFIYPGHPHNVYGKDRVHLMRKVSEYFKTNL
jgi:dipeptidyl-peptidase-4